MTRRTVVWSCLLAAGCGRLGFDTHFGAGDGGATDDGPVIGGGTANRAFVTSMGFDGALGGLAGADAKCHAAAVAGGLQGTFVAFLSTSSSNAIDRLAGSRGWLRVDGAPLVDLPAQLTTEEWWNPLDVDEHGNIVDLTGLPWTGSTPDGTNTGTTTCGDWTLNLMATGGCGQLQSNWPYALGTAAVACKDAAPLYCFEVGHVAHVQTAAIAGRLVFVSKANYAGGGIAALDTMCANEAAAAGFGLNFAAAVATTSASIPTRVAPDARAWRRVDGTEIAVGSAFVDGTPLRSFVTQHADGSYIDPATITLTGAVDLAAMANGYNCSDWTDASSSSLSEAGLPTVVTADGFWTSYGSTTESCNTPASVICFEH